MERQIGDLAHALDESEALAQRFVGKQPAVFLDYDGTLTPIRGRPQDAVISDKMRESVRRPAERLPAVVVSGRHRQDGQEVMGLDNRTAAGGTGSHICRRAGASPRREEGA